MTTEWMPKLGDLKSLQGLSRLLVGPIIVAAYISNTGLAVESNLFSLAIPDDGSFGEYWHYFIGVLLFKAAQALAVFYGPVVIVKAFQYQLGPDWFHIFGVLGLSFGFTGLFAADAIDFFATLHPSAYYASIVAGFYLLSEKWPD
jgi:hypothetical protein